MTLDLGSLQNLISNIGEEARAIVDENWNRYAIRSIDTALKEGISELLYESGNTAAIQTYEYVNSDALYDHFLINLSDPRHPQVRNGEVVRVFNPRVGGTASDFRRGMQAGGSKLPGSAGERAAKIWKYGIYIPAVEGTQPTYHSTERWITRHPDVNYDSVIEKRLSAWGDKAPYWYLINYGNAGYNRAYPTFPPTNFIEKTEVAARRLAKDVREYYYRVLKNNLDYEVERYITRGDARQLASQGKGSIKVSAGQLRGIKIREYINKNGEIFYNIDGREKISYEEFLGKLLRRLRGR